MSTTLPRSDFTPLVAGWQGGNGPSLVLIHGVGLRADAWGAMLPDLTQHFTVTALDMPGHGNSAVFEQDTLSLADYTDRLAGALRQLQTPSYVAGHSMGGLIAMDLAIRHAESVAAIAPLNAIFRRTAEASAAVTQRAASLSVDRVSDPSPILERWFGTSPAGATREAEEDCRALLTSVDPKGYKDAYTVFAHADGPTDDGLREIACPALFMTGSEEPNSTPAMSAALAARVRHGRHDVIEGAHHMMPMTHAAAVTRKLMDFFLRQETRS